MDDSLKDIYSIEFLNDFGDKVHNVCMDFDQKQFTACILSPPWDELQLKARICSIAEKLGEYLPKPFKYALQILFSINESCVPIPVPA